MGKLYLNNIDVEDTQIIGDEFEVNDVRERPDDVAKCDCLKVLFAECFHQLVWLPLQGLRGEEEGHQENGCHEKLIQRHLGQHCPCADQHIIMLCQPAIK